MNASSNQSIDEWTNEQRMNDLIKFRIALIYVGFMIFLNHVVKEFVGLIKKKADYV